MPVNSRHPSGLALEAQWKRLRDCDAGRDAVLAAGTEYLPALPGKPDSDYNTRGNFYNAVRRTRQALTGAITQKEPVFELPDSLEGLIQDLARPRQSGPAFVKRSLDEVVLLGRWGVLVDMPAQPIEGQHPSWIGYRAEDIFSWTVEEIAGADVLTRVILRESLLELDPKDEFVYVRVEQYRVLSLPQGRYVQQVWRQKEGDKEQWVPGPEIVPNRRGVALTFIPFVFLGPTSESAEPEAPPLIDLADLNLAHWRNSADHEYGLHLVALPTPWVSGSMSEEGSGDKKIGPSVVWELDKGGQAGMLEFTGAGLSAIKDAMAAKEKQMASLGARLLEEQQAAPETATAVGMRHAGEHATLRSVAQSVGDGLTRALQIVVWWMGTEAKPDVVKAGVEVNKEFFQIRATPEEVKANLLMLQAEEISYETFYARLAGGGWAREGVTAEEERAQIAREIALRRAPEPEPQPPPEPPEPSDEIPPVPV